LTERKKFGMLNAEEEENTESMKLDDFVKELGLQPDD